MEPMSASISDLYHTPLEAGIRAVVVLEHLRPMTADAAKDPVAVKAIMSKKTSVDAEARFKEILKTIVDLRPRVSIYFYRNLIMDLYGKAVPIVWYDSDQKSNAEMAIQYNIMDPDPPHAYLWRGKKLKKVQAAVRALDEFLESEEAADFVKEHESSGNTMDTDDLEFWEDNLN